MITRIQCGPGYDCAAFTQCMHDTGSKFQSVVYNTGDIRTVKFFFEIVCR